MDPAPGAEGMAGKPNGLVESADEPQKPSWSTAPRNPVGKRGIRAAGTVWISRSPPAAEPDREAVVGVHECDLDIELMHDPEP